jgi:beta-glucosidase
VLVVLSGRPYALGAVADGAAAIVQGFFPGQLGGEAVAGVLTGVANPSGRLPVSIPRHPGGQPGTYLAATLGRRHAMSVVDPTPLFAFGSGIGYTTFEWGEATVVTAGPESRQDGGESVPLPHRAAGQATAGEGPAWPVDGEAKVAVPVRNSGDRAGSDVVQLYLHDPVAQVVRPEMRLVGYTRVDLDAGESAVITLAYLSQPRLVLADVNAATVQ